MSLVLTDVHKSFGDTVVLDGVSLEFPMGKTTAIIGPSEGERGEGETFAALVALRDPPTHPL